MLNTKLANIVVNAQADAMGALLAGGYIDAYDGAQPISGDEPINDQVLCFSLTLGDPAFLPAEDGVLTANPIVPGVVVAPLQNGFPRKATWFRAYLADHETPAFDGSVGTKDANMVVASPFMAPGVDVSVKSFTYVLPKSAPGF